LKAGADVNQVDKEGRSALHLAVLNYNRGSPENIDAVNLLVAQGANVNARDAEGNTPLHHAVDFFEVAIARILINAGADPEAINKNSESPLAVAERQRRGKAMLDVLRSFKNGS
jgi:ankyrin repeat protein